jgi:hypothetical protein
MVSHFQVLDPKRVDERRKGAMEEGRKWLATISAEDVKAKLIKEPQVFRMRVDGTDVGYTVFSEYESPTPRDSYKGVITVMQSRSFPSQDAMLEFRGEAFWAYRKNNNNFNEDTFYSCWNSSTTNNYLDLQLNPKSTWFNEIGMVSLDPALDVREMVRGPDGKPVMDEKGLPVFKNKPLVPTPENTNMRITVNRTGDKSLDPVLSNKQFNWLVQPAMPSVLPKVLENTMWPRLVDLNKPASYAFVVFNTPGAKMGLRTLSVYGKVKVDIDGKKVDAYKLTDELAPSTTTLYADEKGKVLFMKTSDGTSLTPSSDAEMVARWRHRLNIKPAAAGGAPANNTPPTPTLRTGG